MPQALNPISKSGKLSRRMDPRAQEEAESQAAADGSGGGVAGEMTLFIGRCMGFQPVGSTKKDQTVALLDAHGMTSVELCMAKGKNGLCGFGIMPALATRILDEGQRWQLHRHLAKNVRIMGVKVTCAECCSHVCICWCCSLVSADAAC